MNVSTTEDSLNLLCTPEYPYFILAFTIIPVCQIIINSIVIVAVINSRQKLRHNFVYVYVINTSMANLFFGFFSLYEILNFALAFERNWGSPEPFVANNAPWLGWWAFRTGMIVSLFIAMSGSISALIYGIRESSYFIGRTVRHKVKEQSKKKKRTTMMSIIILNWVPPISLCIASSAGWNCASNCKCTPGRYIIYPCQTDVITECSTIMLPQTNSFLLVSFTIWLLESIGIVYMIVTTIQKYNRVVGQNKPRNTTTTSSVFQSEPETNENYFSKTSDKATSLPVQSRSDLTSNIPIHNSTVTFSKYVTHSKTSSDSESVFEETTSSICFKIPPMNHNIKLLLIISVTFIVCTLPAMIVVCIDAIGEEYILNLYTTLICFTLCLVYGSIAPIGLIYYMSGLRSAVTRVLFHSKCCTKTTITMSVSSVSDQ